MALKKRKSKKTRHELMKSVATKAARQVEIEIQALLEIGEGAMPADRVEEWKRAVQQDLERGEKVFAQLRRAKTEPELEAAIGASLDFLTKTSSMPLLGRPS